jgi:hypothetical protein
LEAPVLRVGDWEAFLRKKKEGPAENGRFEGKGPVWSFLAGLTLITLLAAVSCGTGGEQRAEGPVRGEQASVDEPQAETEEPQVGADLEDPGLGSEDAPVVLIEYADYQ